MRNIERPIRYDTLSLVGRPDGTLQGASGTFELRPLNAVRYGHPGDGPWTSVPGAWAFVDVHDGRVFPASGVLVAFEADSDGGRDA